jgi:hypothetical protein
MWGKPRHPVPLYLAGGMLAGLALVFGAASFRLGFFVDGVPGAGLLPLGAAALLLPLVVLALASRSIPEEEFRLGRAPLLGIVALLVYGVLVPKVGFAPATAVLMVLWARFLHGRSWLEAIVFAAAIVATASILFRVLLGVPLPLLPA